jgi:alkylated DNA nucleotide flippase Atl1
MTAPIVEPFARRVLELIDRIPPGRVMSYGSIAERVGAGPRRVGRVLSRWADETQWHRVVYADGTPSSCHDGVAARLLREESTPMVGGRVDMNRAQWPG